MCGIFSAISIGADFDQNAETVFKSALDSLSHRGPDNGNSSYIKSKLKDNFNIFLGHRRLSIIDLEAHANQPFESEGYQLIFNGEIFNYLELKEKLKEDFHFKTKSDTEVVLAAYKKFGTSCFSMFNGMWAIIIYDPVQNCVIVSRDRFSIKPLYYIKSDNLYYFASEIKALRNLDIKLSPNIHILELFLNQRILNASEQTFYNEIKRFPSMHFAKINLENGQFEIDKYWDYSKVEMAPDFEGRKNQFKELLIDSLKLRLRSDVPFGTMLSGGLDSSALTTLAQKNIDPAIRSFSVISNHKKFSEEKFIDKLVNETKVKNQKVSFNEDSAILNIEKVLDIQDEPYGSLSVVAQFLLFQQIKNETDITVLISGQGADEVLLGYNKFFFFHLKDLVKKKKILRAIKMAASSFIKRTAISDFKWKQAKRYLPGKTEAGRNYFRRDLASMPLWDYKGMTDRQIQDINLFSIPALTQYEDRNSMANQLEVRLPFLDYRLVNFLIHLPVEDKLKGGWTKYILRSSISELPSEIRWRRDKKGFSTPEEEWMKGPLGELIISYFSEYSKLEELGILDRQAFITAVKDYGSAKKWTGHSDLFSVYIAEMWLRKMFP